MAASYRWSGWASWLPCSWCSRLRALIAVIRGVERIGLVVLLTVLALGTGAVTWVPALIAAFALPRARRPASRGRPVPPRPGSPPPAAPWR